MDQCVGHSCLYGRHHDGGGWGWPLAWWSPEQVGPEQFTRFLRHRQGLDFVNSMQSPVLCTDASCCCFLLWFPDHVIRRPVFRETILILSQTFLIPCDNHCLLVLAMLLLKILSGTEVDIYLAKGRLFCQMARVVGTINLVYHCTLRLHAAQKHMYACLSWSDAVYIFHCIL